MWQIWLILAGIFVIFEMIIPTDFLIFWVGIAAALTSICSAFIDNITIQILIFCIASILLIFCTKPFIRKFMKNSENIHTNAYSIIGKKGIVISKINNIEGTGQIKMDGEVWSAKSFADEDIPENTEIEIVEIDGVKAVVKETTQKEEDKASV